MAWRRPGQDTLIGDTPTWDERLGAWRVSGYADIDRVLRDPKMFASEFVLGPFRDSSWGPLMERLAQDRRGELGKIYLRMAFIASDGDLHRREHSFVAKAFTPKRVRAIEPTIRTLCEELTEAVLDRPGVSFVQEFAVPLPVRVIAHLLGLPDEDFPNFKRWSDGFEGLTGSPVPSEQALESFLAAAAEFTDYATPLIDQRRRGPTEDLFGALATENEYGELLEVDEILSMCSSLMLAGNETTTAAIAGTMLYMIRTPGLHEEVRGDRALIPALVEEGLRLSAPAQGLFRTATVDAEVGGVPLAKGDFLFLHYAAGNRDEAQFGRALRPDLRRQDKRHLTFGRGPHVCVGAPLARAEMQIGLETLLDRSSSIALADGAVSAVGNEMTARVGELYLDIRT
jgi:cytochrome P450